MILLRFRGCNQIKPNIIKRSQTSSNTTAHSFLSLRKLSLRLQNLNSFYYLYVIICTSLRVFPPLSIFPLACSLSLSFLENFLSLLFLPLYIHIYVHIYLYVSQGILFLSLSLREFFSLPFLPYIYMYICTYLLMSFPRSPLSLSLPFIFSFYLFSYSSFCFLLIYK